MKPKRRDRWPPFDDGRAEPLGACCVRFVGVSSTLSRSTKTLRFPFDRGLDRSVLCAFRCVRFVGVPSTLSSSTETLRFPFDRGMDDRI